MILTHNLCFSLKCQLLYFLLLFQVVSSQFNRKVAYATSISSPADRKRTEIRLKGGRNEREGRIEIKIGERAKWRPVCGHGWNLFPASLACKSLELGFAQFAITGSFRTPEDFSPANLIQASTNHTSRQYIIKMTCLGTENHISDCIAQEIGESECPGPRKNFAGVICNTGAWTKVESF